MVSKFTTFIIVILFAFHSANSQSVPFSQMTDSATSADPDANHIFDRMNAAGGANPVSGGNFVTAMPNPAHSALLVQTHRSSYGIKSVTIFSLTGQLVNKISVENTFRTEAAVPVAGLPEGYYFVTIQLTDGSSVTRRFTKE